MISIYHYLFVSVVLFVIGAFGALARRNIMIILLSIEIMLSAANLSLVAFSSFNNNLGGQVISLFVIAIAASEIAIGLAIAVLVFKKNGVTDPNDMSLMKW